MACGACALLAQAHSALLDQVAQGAQGHMQGLCQRARLLHQRGRLGHRVARNLMRNDAAAAIMWHITSWSVKELWRTVELDGNGSDDGVIAAFLGKFGKDDSTTDSVDVCRVAGASFGATIPLVTHGGSTRTGHVSSTLLRFGQWGVQ